MKSISLKSALFCLALGSAFQSFAAATITVDRVQQRWPWSNKVDVTYTISGDDETATKVCKVTLTTVVDGLVHAVYNPGFNVNVKPGTYTVTWNDPPAGVNCAGCKITATFAASPAVPAGDDYMIVDLKTGAVSYEGVFSAADKFCGVSGQELSNARYNVDKYKSTHYVLRKVPKGTYQTGDGGTATWTTDKDFYMGVFPWTNYQYWYVFDLYDPSARSPEQQDLRSRPLGLVQDIRGDANQTTPPPQQAIQGQWYVIRWLNGKTHMNFDIPTELMHEIATRAGTETPYFWGTDASLAPQYAVCGMSGNRPGNGWNVNVGSRKPNAWGLYDMMGLDWNWCLDTSTSGEDPATRTDVFTPYVGDGDIVRVRCANAKAQAADLRSSARSSAKVGTTSSSPDQFTFRVAYIVPNSGE